MDDMSFEVMGFDELAKELDQLGKIDEYAPEILQAAAPVLEKSLKAEVQKAANRGYASGDLAGSIKACKPGKNEQGHYVVVTAKGKDRKGTRNNEKLAYLNYGTTKQQARPVIARSVKSAEAECTEVIQEKFNEVTGK